MRGDGSDKQSLLSGNPMTHFIALSMDLILCCHQELIIEPDPISTPYLYRTCTQYKLNSDDNLICSRFEYVGAESAQLIPPFTYSNVCGSEVIKSYIPVFLLGASIQLVLPVIVLATIKFIPYSAIPLRLRSAMSFGVYYPEHWLNDDRREDLHNPMVLLNTKILLCNHVLYSWVVLLTFGLFSPVLAVAVSCSVFMKIITWQVLVGRFTMRILESRKIENNSTIRKGDTGSDIHYALLALSKTTLPLGKALEGSFWRIFALSALFVGIICWDIAADENDWYGVIWIPTLAMAYTLVLYVLAIFLYVDKPEKSLVETPQITILKPTHNPINVELT